MIAIGYVRRSTRGDERTVSLEEQRRAVADYCALHNLGLARIIEDDGVSGGDDSRLDRLASALREGSARALVVYHDDRLARSASRLLDFIRELARAGIAVYVVGRGVAEVESSNGFLQTGIHAVIAEHHRLLTAEKTRAALALRREQGRRYCNVAPYGTRWHGNRAVEDEREQKLLERLEFHKLQGLSIRKISQALSREGFLSRSGKPLSPSTVLKLAKKTA